MAKVYGGKLNAISRGLKLHRADMKILRGVPSNEWTPIFDGLTTFVSYYSNFTPSGSNSTLEIALYKQGSKIQTIAFGDTSAFSIQLDASDVLTFNLISNVELNGVPATSGVTTMPDGYYILTGDLDITSDIKYYAANATPANFFGIQIHSMRNLDNYDTGRAEYPVNGRDVVELDGLTQYGEVLEWSATNGVIEFDFIAYGDGTAPQSLIAESSAGNRAYIEAVTNRLKFNFGVAELDGQVVTDNSAVITKDVVYRLKLTVTQPFTFDRVGIYNGVWLLDGFVANLRLTDLDNPSNSRDYPLNRADIIQATPVLQEVPVQYDTNGTVTYDWADDTYFDYLTEIDSKYGDVAPDVNEAVARAFEGLVKNGDFRFGDDGSWERPPDSSMVIDSGGISGTSSVTSNVVFQQTNVFSFKAGSVYEIKIRNLTTNSGWSFRIGGVYVSEEAQLRVVGEDVVFTILATIDSTSFSLCGGNALSEIAFKDISVRKVTNEVVTERTISSEGVFDGNWINAPEPKYRRNNSIDINTVKRSKDAPLASDNLLINSLGSVGDELVVNGDFEDGDTGWNLDLGWGLGSGKVSIFGEGTNEDVCQESVFIPGRTYVVSIEVSDFTANGGNFLVSDSQFVTFEVLTASGKYTFIYNPVDSRFNVRRKNGATGSVGNISVRETTRNVGELVNLTGYELVNRGE